MRDGVVVVVVLGTVVVDDVVVDDVVVVVVLGTVVVVEVVVDNVVGGTPMGAVGPTGGAPSWPVLICGMVVPVVVGDSPVEGGSPVVCFLNEAGAAGEAETASKRPRRLLLGRALPLAYPSPHTAPCAPTTQYPRPSNAGTIAVTGPTASLGTEP